MDCKILKLIDKLYHRLDYLTDRFTINRTITMIHNLKHRLEVRD
jgi:hypothetical protein